MGRYDWAVIPEDLPRKNLILVTAKTPHPTYHADDKEYPVRLFTPQELLEAARSLAHRAIGLNHMGIIPKAFTVDSQYNQSTFNVETLCYFPDEWIDKIRTLLQRKESIFSVKYSWRDEKKTDQGVEFVGLIFDQIDLLCGVNAGDKFTSAQLVEAALLLTKRTGLVESVGAEFIQQEAITASIEDPSISFFKECEVGADEYLAGKHLEECDSVTKLVESVHSSAERLGEPFAGYKDFADCTAKNAGKSNPDAYCGYIKHKVECKALIEHGPVVMPNTLEVKQESDANPNVILNVDKEPIPKQRPEETNLLNNMPQTSISNQDPPNVEKPVMNVASAGFVQTGKEPLV